MRDDLAKRSLIRAALAAPYLDRQEERDLAVRWKEDHDQDALNRIAVAHMRLVISMATKFRGFGLPLGDLIQEGHVGLLEAAARFEPEREVRFSTYATWWIRASIQDYILRNWSIVRGGTSSTQKALFFNLRRLRARLAQRPETTPPRHHVYEQISTALGVSVSDVAMMDSRLSAPDTSLNQPLLDDDAGSSDRMDFLVSDDPRPDEAAEEAIDVERRSVLALRCARRAQPARAAHHPRAPAARRQRDAGVARRNDGHLQGARAPDREPGDGEAEVGAGQGQSGVRPAVGVSARLAASPLNSGR